VDKSIYFLSLNEIKELISIEEVINAVEGAFRSKGLGKVQMPPKSYIFFEKYNGDLRTMPAYIEDIDSAGVKIVNVHPDNPSKYNLPTVMATILLVDPKTGYPLSIMDGTYITSLRTGAAGAIASKYLARRNATKLGLVGAGTQARTQFLAHISTFDLEQVKVYDKNKEAIKNFINYATETAKKDIEIVGCENVRDAVQGVDILCTTTPSREPIVKNDWISPGMHINCIGADAPGKQELDPQILKRAKIVIDDWEQAIHSGEVNVPISQGLLSKDEIYCELGEIVAGIKPGRTSEDEITVFTSTGLAIQDIATASLVYKKARDSNIDVVKLTLF